MRSGRRSPGGQYTQAAQFSPTLQMASSLLQPVNSGAATRIVCRSSAGCRIVSYPMGKNVPHTDWNEYKKPAKKSICPSSSPLMEAVRSASYSSVRRAPVKSERFNETDYAYA